MLRRLYHYLWLFRLTPAGRAFVIGVLLSAMGSVSVEIPVYRIFCLLIAVIGLAEIVGWIWKPKLHVQARFPARIAAGERFTVMLGVENTGWKPAYDVMAGVVPQHPAIRHLDGAAFIPRIGRGGTGELPMTFQALRRGVHRLTDVNVHTTFPINLIRYRGGGLADVAITVVPAFHRIRQFELPVSLRYQPGGVVMSSGLGHSPEYIGNREYTPGEPIRKLDFKAWARTGKPVVREYQEEYYSRIALVLDTFVSGRRRSSPERLQFEAAVSLTAAISEALDVDEYLIDLFAAGPEFHVFRTVGGTNRLDAVLDILAVVDTSRVNPFKEIAPRMTEELEQISTVVCVFLDWDDVRQDFCQRIVEAGCTLKLVIVRDEPTTLPLDLEGSRIVSPEAVMRGAVREI